jgi:lipoyl-dependent peroxiredoxin
LQRTPGCVATDRHEIPRIELNTQVSKPGIDQAAFDRLAAEAKEGCPISKALKAVELSLNARLNP